MKHSPQQVNKERSRFLDRVMAGRELAKLLEEYRGSNAVVLGLPRGGLVVANEIAKALGLGLDVFIARKLGAPNQPELGMGAVAPGGVVYLDQQVLADLNIPREEVSRIIAVEQVEVERRLSLYRGERPPLSLREISAAILVDDGLATGVTAMAAALSLRQLRHECVVLAVPVAAAQSLVMLRRVVDRFVISVVTERLGAVGLWYDNFDQVSDQQVISILSEYS